MDTPETRTRRNIPVETWAVVRDAYLGGETAESIGRRLKMSINTIRKRASRCGWTHAAHARAVERAAEGTPAVPATPEAAMAAALSHAALAMAEGRATDATALIRAAEAMGRVTGVNPADSPLRMPDADGPLTPEQDAAREAAAKKGWDDTLDLIEAQADALARQILADAPCAPAVHSGFVHAWRAQYLGPEAAAHDRAAMQDRAAHRLPFHWRDDGQPLPVDEVRAMYYRVFRRQIRAKAGLPAVGPVDG